MDAVQQVSVDENALPMESLRTPGSGKRKPRYSGVGKHEQSSGKSVKIVEIGQGLRDDSLARAVNDAAEPRTPGSATMLKPSSVRRLQQQSESEKCSALEEENARLKEALKQLKSLMIDQNQIVVNSAAIVEGAKKYVMEKTSAQKATPQRRHVGGLSIKVSTWEKVRSHVEYQIEVKFGAEGHSVTKRYSEFLALRQRVLTVALMNTRSEACFGFGGKHVDELHHLTLKDLRAAQLPGKVWFSNFDENVLKTRCETLQAYLDEIIKTAKRAGRGSEVRAVISDWLGIRHVDEDDAWCDDRIKPLREFDTRARQARASDAFELLLNQSPMTKALSEPLPVAYSPTPLKTNIVMVRSEGTDKDLELL